MTIEKIFTEQLPTDKDAIKRQLTEGFPVILMGMGNLGIKVASVLKKQGVNIIALTDNGPQKQGTSWNDYMITPVQPVAKKYADALWFVSIWSPGHSFFASKKQLQSQGILQVYPVSLLFQIYSQQLLPHYHFDSDVFFLNAKDEILEVYNQLADAESKFQYARQVEVRITGDFTRLPDPDIENQYFPDGLIKLSAEEVFIDAGAYTGDTLNCFLQKTQSQYKHYLALEPDPSNFKKLEEYVSENSVKNISLMPLAVGDEKKQLRFVATGDGGATISEQGYLTVDCDTIDNLASQFAEKITFIKMDIEGAELGALEGSKETILKHHPVLAVCIYHKPDDLWKIPLYIVKEFPFYKIYTRTHQYDGLDFVLYAIPK